MVVWRSTFPPGPVCMAIVGGRWRVEWCWWFGGVCATVSLLFAKVCEMGLGNGYRC